MKKELTRRKRILLLIAVCIAGAALVAVLVLLAGGKPDGDAERERIFQTIPEADLPEADGTKTGSYRRGGIGDYWDSLEKEAGLPDAAGGPAQDGQPGSPAHDGRHPGAVEVNDLFGEYRDAPPPGMGGEPSPRRGGVRPEGTDGPPQAAPAEGAPPEEGQAAPPAAPSRPVKRSGAISSLDEDVSGDLGDGFSTLDGTDRWVSEREGKPYRCMFIRDEKVRSGQRVAVRLLEDLVVGGVHIPKNTHLQGVCTIAGRMEVSVSSLDMGGRIVSLGLEAYDTDGGKGIYCSDLGQAGKEVTEQGIATVSSGLGSRLGRTARDVAAAGASIIRNKAGEATVSVPAGYTFYLMEEKK